MSGSITTHSNPHNQLTSLSSAPFTPSLSASVHINASAVSNHHAALKTQRTTHYTAPHIRRLLYQTNVILLLTSLCLIQCECWLQMTPHIWLPIGQLTRCGRACVASQSCSLILSRRTAQIESNQKTDALENRHSMAICRSFPIVSFVCNSIYLYLMKTSPLWLHFTFQSSFSLFLVWPVIFPCVCRTWKVGRLETLWSNFLLFLLMKQKQLQGHLSPR